MFKLFDKFRPKNDTAEAIAAALMEVEAEIQNQHGRVGDLEAGRGAALLEGGETARRHEDALREARDEVERLEALAGALRTKLTAAEAREQRERLERMAAEAKEKAELAGRAIAKNYPRLAKELIKLLEDERDALQAIAKIWQYIFESGEDAAGILPIKRPHEYYAQSNPFVRTIPLCSKMTVPRHDESMPEHGSPPLWRGDVDVVTASARGGLTCRARRRASGGVCG
jgi:hypothetical protein